MSLYNMYVDFGWIPEYDIMDVVCCTSGIFSQWGFASAEDVGAFLLAESGRLGVEVPKGVEG